MTRRHCLVFDLDDTLYLERDYVRSGFRMVDERARQSYGVEGLYAQLERVFAAGERKDVIGGAWRALGLPAQADVIDDLVRCYREHEPSIELLPSARVALDWAVSRGPVAVLTDGDAHRQERKVAALGLRQWADPVIITGRLGKGHGKPAPLGYELVALRWTPRSYRHVYVGDNPIKDFVAPRSLGWTTVRIRHAAGLHAHSESGSDVDHELLDIGDLPDLLLAGLVRARHKAGRSS